MYLYEINVQKIVKITCIIISPDKRHFNFTGNHSKLSVLQCGSQKLDIVSLSLRIIVPFFFSGVKYALVQNPPHERFLREMLLVDRERGLALFSCRISRQSVVSFLDS